MAFIRKAKIVVHVGPNTFEMTLTKPEEKIYEQIISFHEDCVTSYLKTNHIEDAYCCSLVRNSAWHDISFEDDIWVRGVFIVATDGGKICGVLPSRADAEEYIFSEVEDEVYTVMMMDDAYDIFGRKEWNYSEDYKCLMSDFASYYYIEEAPFFEENY